MNDGHRIVDRDGIEVVILSSAEAAAILPVLRRALADDERRNGARHPVLGRLVHQCQLRVTARRTKSSEQRVTCNDEANEPPAEGDVGMIVPMLSVAEVAHELGVTARRVQQLIVRGQLAAIKIAGKFRIAPEAFAAFVDDRQEAP